VSKLKLSKPIDIDGELKSKIDYDLEELTGDAVENAMKSLQKKGYVPTVQELDPLLHGHIFAEAAGLDYEDIKRLSAKDYLKAVSAVRDFFLEDSEDSQPESISEQ
jgi:hypothetical protein